MFVICTESATRCQAKNTMKTTSHRDTGKARGGNGLGAEMWDFKFHKMIGSDEKRIFLDEV